jgi:hypothetical protein
VIEPWFNLRHAGAHSQALRHFRTLLIKSYKCGIGRLFA